MDLGRGGSFALGSRQVRRIGYGAMQLAGDGADGRIFMFDNFSGHYKPGYNPGFETSYGVLRDIALNAFERSGFSVTPDVVWKPKVWKPPAS